MSRERNSNTNLDDGPSFDADSIHLPEELRETSNFGQARPKTLSRKEKSPVVMMGVIGAVALLAGVGYALLSESNESAPSNTPSKVVGQKDDVGTPSTTKDQLEDARQKPLSPATVTKIESQPAPETTTKTAAQVAPKLPTEKPSNNRIEKRSVDRPKEKPVKKARPSAKRKQARRSLDDALAKLDGIDEESDQSTEKVSNNEDKPVSTESSAPESMAAACANGDVKACVKAAKAAQKEGRPEKARTFYGTACAKKLAIGCFELANLLESGVGGPQNKKLAASLRAKACQLGHNSSCASVKTRTSTRH